MSNLVEYDPIDMGIVDDIDEDADYGGNKTFLKLGVGDTVVRFLPPKKGQKPVRVVHEHYVKLAGRQTPLRFACPRSMTKGKERCPVCEEADALSKTGNPVDKERAGELYSRLQLYTNVIDRKHQEEGPKILTFGKSIWEQLKSILEDKNNGGDFFNPGEKGFDIVINRVGKTKNDTKYTVRPARNDSVLGNNEWLDQLWPIDQYAQVPDSSDLLGMLRGETRRGLSDGRRGSAQNTADKVIDVTRGAGRHGRTAQDDIENDEDVPL